MSNSRHPWAESTRTTNALLSLVVLTLAAGFLHLRGDPTPFMESILYLVLIGSFVAAVFVVAE